MYKISYIVSLDLKPSVCVCVCVCVCNISKYKYVYISKSNSITNLISFIKKYLLEFPLWRNVTGSISTVAGCGFNPQPSGVGSMIQHCCSCGVGHNCGSDLIPGPEAPYTVRQPKKEKKKNLLNAFSVPSIYLRIHQ